MSSAVKEVVIGTDFIPRTWQQEAFADMIGRRHAILVFHRRGGKTVYGINYIKHYAINFNKLDPEGRKYKNPQFAFVATTRGQVEQIAWQYFKDFFGDIPGVKFNEAKLTVKFPHPHGICTVFLFGAENFDAMRGLYLDGYILDEYADMHPDVRDKVLLPTLSDRKGWEIIIGTPKGENAFKELYDIALDNRDMWYSCLFRASETSLIPDDELAMLKKTMSDEAYRQEYECDFNAAPSGKYYQSYIDDLRRAGQVTSVPYDNEVYVTTYWDLGFSDSTAIWFVQEVGRELRIINYMQWEGKGLDSILPEVDALKYRYNVHKVPHDASHHELSTGRARIDFMREHTGIPVEIIPKTKSVAEDIHVVRQLLPKCWFDSKECFEGIKALSAYERKWDARRQVYSDTPLHNWASHAADAFRQFAVDYQPGFSRSYGSQNNNLPTQASCDYDILTEF